MSGLFRSLIFGDLGNWHYSNENQVSGIRHRNNIRKALKTNYDIDADQEKRLIQLEVLCGSLISMMQEKGMLDNEEIESILKMVDESAVDVRPL